MSKVEVLVACMHQKDDSLYREMNLQPDAILANQGDEFFYKEYKSFFLNHTDLHTRFFCTLTNVQIPLYCCACA